MPFYIRLGPHGLIIFIGAILHTRLGRTIYRRRRRRYAGQRSLISAGTRAWRADAPENLTPEPVFVQIVRSSAREATDSEPARISSFHRESA